MSMISAQCDELREKAQLLRGHVDGLSAPYVVPSTKELMALTMLDSASRMEGAADTILSLRDKAQDMQAENDKLRELVARARDPQRIGGQADQKSFAYAIEQLREFRWQHATNDEDAIPYINNVADAHERENAKLRELVRDMLLAAELGEVQIHVKGGDWRTIKERAYDVLGVEVDDGAR